MQAHIPSLFPLHSLLTLTSVIPLHFRSFPRFFVNLPFVLPGTLCNLNSSSLILLSHAYPLPLLSVVPQSSGATEADKATCTCLFPSPIALPSQQPASAWGRLRCGWQCCSWFFFGSNHSQRADHGLIWFFTAWPYFSHQQHECPSPPTTLLIKFAPYAFEGSWTDWRACFFLTSLPSASGLIRPQPWRR